MSAILGRFWRWLGALFGPSSEVLWLRARVEQLEVTVRDLKKGGFTYEPNMTYVQSDEGGLDERITDAITAMAPGNRRLQSELADWARGQLVMEVGVEDVVDGIFRGAQL